jgi:uncharacterized protein
MVLKEQIQKAYEDQQSLWMAREPHAIARTFMQGFRPAKSHIEVISGIRRCGKSTLMRMIRDAFYPGAAYFNFEDSRVFGFDIQDFAKLDEIIPRDTPAYFFDEIQNVDKWELFVRQLHDRGDKVFITGSNASLLSVELGTRLTGRHLRHDLFPFSYTEFLSWYGLEPDEHSFKRYLEEGGFPEFLDQKDPLILQSLFKDIVMRDIAIRHGVRNVHTLMELGLHLITNSGKETSFNSLRKQFFMGAANTASDFVNWLENAWLIFQVQRFSWSAKARITNPRKIYGVDSGLIQANTQSFSPDYGRRLENAVYVHLRQSGWEIYYFREERECDFVIFDQKTCKAVMQVCQQLTPDNQKREVDGLLEAMHFFDLTEGFVVTANQSDTLLFDGKCIRLVPAHQFMTEHTIGSPRSFV